MELVGMKAIADHVKMSEATVLSWIREAAFPAKKIRGRGIWLSDTDAVAAWRKGYVLGQEPPAPPPSPSSPETKKRKPAAARRV